MLVKGWSERKKFYPYILFPALLTTLSIINFAAKEITGCTNEAANGGNKAPEKCFIMFYCFSNSIN